MNYQGNANDAFFGQEIRYFGFVGGYTSGSILFETATVLFAPFSHGTYLFPTAFESGRYDLRGFTYGYVQDETFSVYVQRGQVADIKLNLVVGVNVTLDILFKKEHIITATNANMSVRVRLFDDSGNLVAEWMSSEDTYVTVNGIAHGADGTKQYPFGPSFPLIPSIPKLLNSYNFLPGGVKLLHVVMSGLPSVPPLGQESKAGLVTYKQFMGKFIGGPYFGDPIFTHTLNIQYGWGRSDACDFSLDCYANPGPNWNAPGFFPNTGILGAPDYQGGWTAEIDFVNWYANNTSSTQNCVVSLQIGTTCYGSGNYYPPVPGLLMGESYHIIPGTTAKSGISLVEDGALDFVFLGHSMAPNHLGPYSQQGTWQISGAHNSGEASAIYEVDLNGLVSGNALAFTWSNEFRPLSWGTLTVTGAGLLSTGLNFYTYDGVYEAYLPSTRGSAGSVFYTFSLNAPGYAPQTWKGAVSPGQTGKGQNLYLEQTNIPVPEFSTLTILTFTALAASVYVLRRKDR